MNHTILLSEEMFVVIVSITEDTYITRRKLCMYMDPKTCASFDFCYTFEITKFTKLNDL